MRSNTLLIALFFIVSSSIYGQSKQINTTFEWSNREIQIDPTSSQLLSIHTIQDGQLKAEHPEIPVYSDQLKLSSNMKVKVEAIVTKSSVIELKTAEAKNYVSPELEIWSKVEKQRNDYVLTYGFIPIIEVNGGYEKVEQIRILVEFGAPFAESRNGPTFADNSVLADGQIYKVSFSQSGVYKMDYNFLKDLGLDIDNINPKNLAVYTSEGRAVPENLFEARFDDLVEMPILVEGENDNTFNGGDYILFYGSGSESWTVNDGDYQFNKNIYSDLNYAYIKVKNQEGKRILEAPEITNVEFTSGIYHDIQRLEEDKVNLLGSFSATQGTGQQWYGDRFNTIREYDYTEEFDFNGYIPQEEIEVSLGFTGRSDLSNSRVFLDIADESFDKTIVKVETVDNISTTRYANFVQINTTATASNANINVGVRYPFQGNLVSEGWLDYLQMVIPKTIAIGNGPVLISNRESKNHNTTALGYSGNSDHIWDVSDISSISKAYTTDNQIRFNSADDIKMFYAFDENNALTPTRIGEIENQNLHSITDADMLVIYHPIFEADIERYVEHRSTYNNIKVEAVDINKIYNEYSGGKVDPTAIRDFAKMLYDRSSNFKYVLLVGDGTYDYKQLMPDVPDHNFIPVYETKESLSPINGFPTDDYFALLDDSEGTNLVGQLDIAVGRLPVQTQDDFASLVDKFIHYDTSAETQGDWKLKLGFAADDEEARHVIDTERLSNDTKARFPDFNHQKIYFDAFLQESTPGGTRFPDATKEINNAVFKGLLVLNYLGHGGPKGWAQERVLQVSDILSWDDFNKMPLLITATCTFTGYDEPTVESAGESSILNPRGGAIGLYSTTRAVFASDNYRLVDSVYDTLFSREGGQLQTLGEIITRAKNNNFEDTMRINARKFSLIGDPAMRLSVPPLNVETSSINGISTNTFTDTLRALDKVVIEGIITDSDGQLVSDYNGLVYPTIFDKESTLRTLANDASSGVRSFNVFKNVLFKGAATVTNGRFTFEFVIPKDIDYSYGTGRISYYATNSNRVEAKGSNGDIMIGGTSNNIISDDEGPEIELFMNDESFVYGGITNTDPVLLVKLEDENGINVTGTSIGHDLSGTLDEDNQGTFIMNEFYEAAVDNFRQGTARYPLSEISSGRHSVTVKAWDVLNNSSEMRTEFVVIQDGDNILEHVLNYPNPFTTSTNFQFEHDLANTELDILVSIYTVTGKVIKTIEATKYASGFRVDDIHWDGTDDYGSDIGKGVYLYKIKARSDELNLVRESDFEKLVILK